jgi:hypothetical protein
MFPFIAPSPADRAAPTEVYQARRAHFAALHAEFERRSDRQGIVNVALFFGALAALLIGFFGTLHGLYWLVALLALGFSASFAYHVRIDEQRRRYHELVRMQDEAQARLRRDWKQMPLPAYSPISDPAGLARDLDLTGHASLLHLLGTARTPAGLATLQSWLLESTPRATARERQGMIRALAQMADFRDALALDARLMGQAQHDYEAFARWAAGPSFFAGRQGILWTARILPVITLALVIAQIAGWIPFPLWLVTVAVAYGVTNLAGKEAAAFIEEVAERNQVFAGYAQLFALLGAQDFPEPGLRAVQARLQADGVSAAEQMRRLGRIMPLVELRRMPLFMLIQVFTLLMFHNAWLLDRWRQRAHAQVGAWLVALGEFEALAALATLAHDQPAWAFPDLCERGEAPEVTARDLGHPLLPPDRCVGNDISIGPPGRFVLVTGSNMSGKSTLLRAVGVNVVLGQAGGPVCAAALRLPPVRLATSIRVADSLEQGVSYFMAELRQLKTVVDAAQSLGPTGDAVLLFLLDEILHGTNTAERQIAARHIIRRLLDLGALGMVSTHDLTLAAAPELLATADLVHFTEDFTRVDGTPVMRFDYRLRPGLATSTNALKLMEIVGLPPLEVTATPEQR